MPFADDIRRSNSLINYLLTELEQIDVVDEADAGACGEQLSLWARYASQQLYFEGHRRQSDFVLNLCDAFSAEDHDSARKINPRSDLVYRIEIYRGILEELLDASEANTHAPRAPRFKKPGDVPEVDNVELSQEPPAVGGGFVAAHDPFQYARGSTLSARKSLVMLVLVLAVSATLFFKLFDLKDVAAALSGTVPPSARNANEPKPPSGIRHQDLGNADSIFLTKLDNPPEERRQQKFTIWLAATGSMAYVIDSVTVKKRGGIFDSEVGPGPPWDADYVIDYKGYFDETHSLKPPLVLNPSEGELSFTLVLRHVTEYGVYCDKVGMEINYIGADGTEGKLYIKEPPEEALTLSSLLETDIESRGFITTPQGVQRGIAGNKAAAAARLIYEPVEDILASAYEPSLTPERAALDKAVESKKVTPKIIELLGANNRAAFDICSTLPDPRCEAALMRAGASVSQMRNALHYMSRRHLLKPSSALADFILSVDLGKYVLGDGAEADLGQAARALVYRPSGRWVRALLVLARINKDADSLLDFNMDSMTERDRRMVEEFRLREMNGGEGRNVGVPRSRGRLSGARDER